MKINGIVLLLLSASLLFACETSKMVDEKKIAEFLPSDDARKNWEKVQDQDIVNALNELNNTETLISQRKRNVLSEEDMKPQTGIPVFNKSQKAGVEVRSSVVITSFKGIFKVQKLDSNLISGIIEKDVDFRIYYKMPKTSFTRFIDTIADLSMFYETKLIMGSLNKTLILRKGNKPLIISIEEGSEKPYQKVYSSLNLTLQQIIEENQDEGSVEVTYFNQKITLEPGQTEIVRTPVGDVEFFLLTSYARTGYVLKEGLDHYIRLYAYAL